METDKDHIHYMIETESTMFISKMVNLMKSYTTYHIWERYPNYLRKHFWIEHTFWTDGYFACSVGNVSEEMLRKYIENQGYLRSASTWKSAIYAVVIKFPSIQSETMRKSL